MEEPVCEPPAVALYYVSKLARESGVKVLLSGEGGDEAFGGYPEYRNFSASNAEGASWAGARSAGAGARRLASRTRLEAPAQVRRFRRPDVPDYYFSRRRRRTTTSTA